MKIPFFNKMSDLSLISLNNTVVGLRKPIAKAEVHIINKLTRQVIYFLNLKQIRSKTQKGKVTRDYNCIHL